jgi:hypothetical protein
VAQKDDEWKGMTPSSRREESPLISSDRGIIRAASYILHLRDAPGFSPTHTDD